MRHAAKGAKTKKQKKAARRAEKKAEKVAARARTRDSLQALSKLGELVDGRYRIVSQPPIVVPARELEAAYGLSRDQIERDLHQQFRAYRATLQDDRRRLLEQYEVVDVARKVVGVGSVGTREFIVLLQGRDQHDPLFLQVKEATRSVLEGPLPKSRYKQHGERVVDGQRMLQAASDIFLGWARGVDVNRYFYWRQLRDMKGSVEVESMAPVGLRFSAPATRSRSPPTWVRATSSTGRSATSPRATPTRTSATTRPSRTRSAPDDSRHSKASEEPSSDHDEGDIVMLQSPLALRPRLDLSDQVGPEADCDLGDLLLVSQHAVVVDLCRGPGPHVGVVEQDGPAV
jgi:Uncharacterized protein conserved in bacteria (DUF2252)